MAITQKFTATQTGTGVAVGGNIWNLTVVRTGSSRANKTVRAIIESVSPSVAANKRELRNGEGDTYGLYFNDVRKNVSVGFYILGTSASDAASQYKVGDYELILPADEVKFTRLQGDGDAFPMLENGRWIVDSVNETRAFGEVRMFSITLTSYDNIA